MRCLIPLPRVSGHPYTTRAARISPCGSSLTLAAIYSRGTCRPTTIDVLMFHFRVRNGTGWDHQAMTTRLRGALLCYRLLTVYPVGHVFAALLLRGSLGKQQTDIRVAMRVGFQSFAFPLNQAFFFKACHRGWYEVYWMLVALGSIHYCNYTCALSTWSSSTLL